MRGQIHDELEPAQSHLLADEVNIDLSTLHASMVDMIYCHIDSAHVVTVNNRGRSETNMKFP
jgi:hypothetical protein